MKRVSRRVEFIEKQKERTSRFLKRRTGLINKAREFSVLCGVDTCMIIKAPRENNNNNDELIDTVWSSSSDNSDVMVQKLIHKYKQTTSVEDKRNKDYSVKKYFLDKKRKAETELKKLKEKNRQGFKLRVWDLKFDSMNEHELRDLAKGLEVKIDGLKRRRELMMKNKRIDNNLLPMEPSYPIPIAMNSLHYNGNYNSQAIQSQMNSIDNNNYYVQPVGNPMGQPMFDHYTPTNSQPQFSFSDALNHARMNTDMPQSFVSDHNAYNFSMLQGYVYSNYRVENTVQRQSFYDLPSPPPLMIDYSTNGHVSSQMQYSEQQPALLYNFQQEYTNNRHIS